MQENTIDIKTVRAELIKAQLRNPAAYWEQACNLVAGVLRVLGHIATATATITWLVALCAMLTTDLSAYSWADLKAGLRMVTFLAALVAAMTCLLDNTGRFRNVFIGNADRACRRFAGMADAHHQRTHDVERVLIQYGLISEAEVKANAVG